MGNKFDFQTVIIPSITGGASGVHSIGTAIPAGRTRFLTYIKIERASTLENSGVTGVTGIIASTGNTAVALNYSNLYSETTSGLVRLQLKLHNMSTGGGSGQSGAGMPDITARTELLGTMDHPILAVTGGASAYMVYAHGASVVASQRLFAQYYDE